ncbi:hypothetical protein [uncultured Robinsoniella sp.]|uniref:hypothetical protein n=1 Tax=uncultured Robinsoniella sp. TaxID=904190 RepID=UPI0020454B21|nr:MAG TPA: chromosome segregation protein [Caudoviricetes sp.]
MSLKNIGNVLNAFKSGSDLTEVAKNIGDLDKAAKAMNSVKGLPKEDKVHALKQAFQGISEESIQAAINLNTVDNVVDKTSTKVGGLKNAFTGLASTIGISTTTLGVLTGVVAAAGVGFMAYSMYQKYIEECVESAKDASDEWTTQNSTLSDQKEKISELRNELNSGNLSEQETYSIKSQILDIQKQIVSTYGEQASGIDLINGNLDKQKALIDQISKSEADRLINENTTGIDKAKKEMEKSDRKYKLGSLGGNNTELNEELKNLVSKYSHKGISFGAQDHNSLKVPIYFEGDAKTADAVINDFATDVKKIQEKYKDDQIDNSWFQEISSSASSALKDNKEILTEYKDLYNQSLMADMFRKGTKDTDPAGILNKYRDAVEKYNEALLKDDENSKAKASADFSKVQESVDGILKSNPEYADIFNEISQALDKSTAKAYEFNEAISGKKKGGKADAIKRNSDRLKDEKLSNIDVEAAFLTDGYQKGEAYILNLATAWGITADSSSEEITQFTDALIKAGIISGKVSSDMAEDAEIIPRKLSELLVDDEGKETSFSKQVGSYEKSLDTLKTAMGKVNAGNISDSELMNLLTEFPELTDTTDDLATAIQNLMGTTADGILGTLDENIKALNEAGKDTSGLEKYRDAIANLKKEASQTDWYSNLTDGIDKAFSSANSGDSYAKLIEYGEKAKKLREEGLVGTDDFKEFAKFISPTGSDGVQNFDENIGKFNRYFTADSNEGVLNFLDDLSNKTDKAGEKLATFDDDAQSWSFNIKDMEQSATDMGMSFDEMLAMFGRLEDYGAHNNFYRSTEEASERLTTLYTEAAEAEKRLAEMEQTGQYETKDENGNAQFTVENQAALDEQRAKVNQYKRDIQETQECLDALINKSADDYNKDYENAKHTYERLQAEKEKILSEDTYGENSEGVAAAIQRDIDQILKDNPKIKISVEAETENPQEPKEEVEKEKAELPVEAKLINPGKLLDGNDPVSLEVHAKETINPLMSGSSNLGLDTNISGVTEKVDEAKEYAESSKSTMKIDADDSKAISKANQTVSTIDAMQATIPVNADTFGVTSSILSALAQPWSINVAANVSGLPSSLGLGAPKIGVADGTAHADGTIPFNDAWAQYAASQGYSFASGTWGLPQNETALINELGQELLVRDGAWHLIPAGARFMQLKKNDIIFNHRQTQELFKNGNITGTGKLIGGSSHANGTVRKVTGASYSTGMGSLQFASGIPNKSSSANTQSTQQNTQATNQNSQAQEDNTEKTKESTSEIDNFATRLSYFSRKTKNIIDSITDYVSSAVKSSRLKRGMTAKENEISANERSYEGYMNAANGVALDESWKQKVRDGDYSIDTIDTSTDEGKKLQENIDKYKKYYEAALNCKDAVSQLRREQQELYTQWANVPIEAYEKKLERLGNDMDVLDAKVQARTNTNTGYLLKRVQTEDKVHLSAKKSTRNKAKSTLNKTTKSNDKIGDKLEKKVKKSKVKSSTKKKITSNIEKGKKVSTKGIKDKKLLSQIEDWNNSVGKKSKDEKAFKKADKTYQKAQGKVDHVKGVSYGYTNKLLDKEVAIQKKQNNTARSTKKKTASIAKKTGHQLDYQKSTTKAGNKLLNDKMSKSQRKSVQKAVKSGKKVSTKGLEGNALKDAKNYNKIVADNKKNKDTTANKLLKSTKLSKSQRSAVEAGKTVSTKGLKGNDLKKAKAYNEAVKKNNEALKAQKTAADNAAKAQAELAQKMGEVANQQMENVKAFYEAKGSYYSTSTDTKSKQRELKIAQGKELTEGDFQSEITAKKTEKDNLTAQKTAMQSQLKSLVDSGKIKVNSEDWYKWTSDIDGVGNAALDAEIALKNLEDSQANLKIEKLGYSLDAINAKNDNDQANLDLKQKQGQLLTGADYKNILDNSSAKEANLIAQNKALAEQKKNLDVNSQKYQEIQNQINSNEAGIQAEKQAREELNHTIENLPTEKLQKELDLLDAQNAQIKSQIDLLKAKGKDLSSDDYKKQMSQNDEEIKKQQAIAKEALANAQKYSYDNEYYKQYMDTYYAADTAINNLEADNESLQDTMRNDIYFRGFERALEAANHLRNTISGIGDLISEDMMYDDDGKLTDFGITKLATSVKEYESYMGDIQTIQQKIATIQGLKGDKGYSEIEYTEDLRKAQEELTEAIKNGGNARETILSIMKSQSKAELDAIFKVIDARNKLLQKTEDYYNYDKNMKKSSKELQQLKAQAAALDGVTDAESRAQKARLDAQIKEKEEEIEDTVHEQTIKIQMDGLDELKAELQEDYDKYIKDLAQNLDKITDLINGATDIVTSSFGKVGETIQKMLESLGVDPKNFDWSGLGGAAKGGIIEKMHSNGDSLLASVNPGETILTQDFTKILPEALFTMKAFHARFADSFTAKMPNIEPRESTINQQIECHLNVQGGNTGEDTIRIIKQQLPMIAKYTGKEFAKDLRKIGLR